ncbi:hypothetical protein MQE22_05010 [Acidithiobacillus sp. YTS05]|uniref:Uncharacterized protein n=1 Tax=Igneacidithiobacillus copahuensis TaxID=2724909 RepID=A0AAE3CJ15_9PROT|nr:hypothetical protein [Igneacidithiobacillus copahuensis]MBU2754319.1 hypothetical protein [Acidithiobacillus sp. CV18-3]MBU2757658.1 hypothetical protein [Acidithiobacillus sp. BN09-2]MBU2797331.1 hypothetical protein [Acidithiobacillus sp. VAN18-2]UTV81988.1 hypothetical protein MQE22_05010 [Acidithiobacillus sp. YTS05]MBU2787312.1 hypothetical protein [Igneacidithiobacillus copahuensis]
MPIALLQQQPWQKALSPAGPGTTPKKPGAGQCKDQHGSTPVQQKGQKARKHSNKARKQVEQPLPAARPQAQARQRLVGARRRAIMIGVH